MQLAHQVDHGVGLGRGVVLRVAGSGPCAATCRWTATRCPGCRSVWRSAGSATASRSPSGPGRRPRARSGRSAAARRGGRPERDGRAGLRMHHDPRAVPVPVPGDDLGALPRVGGRDLLPDQGVEQRRLARLDLAGDRDAQRFVQPLQLPGEPAAGPQVVPVDPQRGLQCVARRVGQTRGPDRTAGGAATGFVTAGPPAAGWPRPSARTAAASCRSRRSSASIATITTWVSAIPTSYWQNSPRPVNVSSAG